MANTLVVGGGLAGLAAAHALQRQGHGVTLVEQSSRPGGVVGSLDCDGFLFETGPNTIPRGARHFRTLCHELGIADRLIRSLASAKTRWLWHAGRLQKLPEGPAALLGTGLLSWSSKLRLLSEPLRSMEPAEAGTDEPSLADFLSERIGEEATMRFAGAFVRGVYAGDVRQLGARSAFPSLWQAAQEKGGLLRGGMAMMKAKKALPPVPGPEFPRGCLLSFPRGLQELVDALAAGIDDLRLNCSVESIEQRGDLWSVACGAGESMEAERLVLALPAGPAGRLLETLLKNRPGKVAAGRATAATAARAIAQTGHAAVDVVHMGFDRVAFGDRPPPTGFGYLVPPDAGQGAPPALGTLFVSNLFADRAPDTGVSFTAIYRRGVLRDDDDDCRKQATADLAGALGRKALDEPRVHRRISWQSVIPQYAIGHRDRVAELQSSLADEFPGLAIAGSWVAGVSVDDVIASGRAAAAAIGARAPRQVCEA